MPRHIRLLLIEDSDADAELLLRELARSGFDVAETRVETAREMTAAITENTFDLVISDYRLPQFSAMKALEALKDQAVDVPILVVSGTIGEQEAVGLLRAGARDFFLKDGLSRLGTAIDRELAELESRRKQRRSEEQKRQAQKALARSEAFLRQVVESSPNGILSIDVAGTIRLANRQIELMFGYSREELVGQSMDRLKLLPRSSRLGSESHRAKFLGSPEERVGLSEREVRGRRKDGSEFPVKLGLSLLNADPESLILATIVDITEWRALEGQLQQAQKMEAIGRLAGGLAHDFNNVLSVILAAADIASDELSRDHSVQELLLEIESAARKAADLTHQMLAFSRQQVLRPRQLNLNDVIEDSIQLLAQMIGEDVELRAHLDRDLGMVLADATQLGQVLMNLAVNARDAMPGGGKLTFETANVDLDDDYVSRHAAGTPGPYVMLLVSDSGSGMDAETRFRVFEPFFTTKEEGKGTGLGLSTVYGIVKQSGGFIWLYSEPGHGATFRIYLPRHDEHIEDSGAFAVGNEIPAAPSGIETVLLVEDQEPVRRMTRRLLRRQGYEVLDAAEGTEALRIVEQFPGEIHLLLTDVVMPGTNGRELAQQVQALRPDVRVLFMSGYSNGVIEDRGLLDESVNLLEKPFSARTLAKAVRGVLDSSTKRGS